MFIIKTVIYLLLRCWQCIYSSMYMVKIYDTYFLESELIYHENVETFLKEKTHMNWIVHLSSL